MATMKDIANRLGITTATVSYALNNSRGQVSDDLRAQILRVAAELNYVPNRAARGLRTSKTYCIGVIAEDITVFNTPGIIDGIEAACEARGYSIMLSNMRVYQKTHHHYAEVMGHRDEFVRATSALLAAQVEAIVYVGEHPRDVSGILPEPAVPTVYVYCTAEGTSHPTVNYDDEQGAYDAVNFLCGSGHRNIGIIGGPPDSPVTQRRISGAMRAIADFGAEIPDPIVAYGDWEVESGARTASELLSGRSSISALFAMNDPMAYGAIRMIKRSGLVVPNDISVIGFDDREASSFFDPPLTTMSIPLSELGRIAAQFAIENRSDDDPHERQVLVPCSLVERESVMRKLPTPATE